MLGDKPIFIQEVKKIELPKNRINLPKNIEIEPNEQLVFVNEDDYGFSISDYNKFLLILKGLESNKNEALKSGNINKYIKLKNSLDYLCCNIYGTVLVSSDLRIVIPPIIIDEYSLEDEVYLQGSYDRLNIFKNKEKFKQYKKSKKRS